MEFETEPSNASTPHAYVTAPTSPGDFDSTNFYYSAPVSPFRNPPSTNLVDFEFETSKKFSGQLESFADELFLNGLVMPLKLPPRLQYDSDSFSLKSQTSSPARPAAGKKNRKGPWNDDFDPFMVALQKVREDKRGGRGIQRSRSYSPFRAMVARCSSECNYYDDCDFSEESSPVERKHAKGLSLSGPLLDFKGPDQRRFLLGERVRPVRNDQDKQARPEEKIVKAEESKVKKLKGFILKYVLFGRGSKQAKALSDKHANKPNKHYNRLGFKSKESAQGKMSAN